VAQVPGSQVCTFKSSRFENLIRRIR